MAEHINLCPVCGANPHTAGNQPAPLRIPTPKGPNERVHVDLFGPLKTSSQGNAYVLIYTDAFTRLTRLAAIKDKSAETVADAILHWIYLFGIPKTIISDQGREFCNELSQNLFKSLQIEHNTTTPYHPQCNAAAERFNRTMAQYLRKAIMDSDKSTLEWELYLGPLTLSFNSAVNKSTRVSPYYATFGMSPRVPLWTSDLDEPVHNDDYATALQKIRTAQSTAHKVVHLNDQHDRIDAQTPSAAPTTYSKFDRVWIAKKQTLQPNPKLNSKADPGIILSHETETTYKVINLDRKRKRPFTVNASLLRPRNSPHALDKNYIDVSTILNTIDNTNIIKHALPTHVHKKPFLETTPYINHDLISDEDIVKLLLNNCKSHLNPEKRFESLTDDAIFFNLPEDVAAGQRQLLPEYPPPQTVTIPDRKTPPTPHHKQFQSLADDMLFFDLPDDVAAGERQLQPTRHAKPPAAVPRKRPTSLPVQPAYKPTLQPSGDKAPAYRPTDDERRSPPSSDSETEHVVKKFKQALSRVFPTPFRRSTRLERWGISPPDSDNSVDTQRSRSPQILFPDQPPINFPQFPYREPNFSSSSNSPATPAYTPNPPRDPPRPNPAPSFSSLTTDRSRSTVPTRHGLPSLDTPMHNPNRPPTPDDFASTSRPFLNNPAGGQSNLALPYQPGSLADLPPALRGDADRQPPTLSRRNSFRDIFRRPKIQGPLTRSKSKQQHPQ